MYAAYRTQLTTIRNSLVIRRGTEMDFEAVMDIDRNARQKLDCSPELYYIYLHDNSNVVYVVEQNGHMLAMVNYALNFDETQVTKIAVLEHPSYKLGNSVKCMLLKDFPKMKQELYSVINCPEDTVVDESSEMYRWNGNAYILSIQDVLSQITTTHSKSFNLIDLSYSTSVEWLSETNVFEDFFQQYVNGYIPVNSMMKPIELLNKNELKEVFTSSQVFVAFQDWQHGEPLTTKQLPRIITLSYCSIVLLHKRCRVDMYYYGHVAELQNHVRAQLSYIVTVWEGSVAFFIHYPKDLQFHEVENCFKVFNITAKLVPEYKHFEAKICRRNFKL